MSSFQEAENFQTQQYWEDIDCCNEEEPEFEEALSLSDLPITTGIEEDGTKVENESECENLEFDFDFGSMAGSISALDDEMCAADEVFSGGQMLPYRNSVSSMSGLRSVSRSESIDRRGFGFRSCSSRSSSVRSGCSTCSSNNTATSAKTVPLVSKSKVAQNLSQSYPSPKPKILGTGSSFASYASNATPIGKKSKMWEVLKLGLVRTPEIELQDLKLRHHRTNDFDMKFTIHRNNSIGSSCSSSGHKARNNNIDRARKSCSADGHRISEFVLEMQKRKNQLSKMNNGSNSGFFKSCKCAFGAIEPMPIRSSNGYKSGYFESNKFRSSQNTTPASANQDKNVVQREHQLIEEQQQQQNEQQRQQRRNSQIRQGKQVMSHHHRTFEWLKNLSRARVLNNSKF